MSDSRSRGQKLDASISAQHKELIEKIFKSGEITNDQQALSKLKRAIGDEGVLNVVFDFYKQRSGKIDRIVNKFKDAFWTRYASQGLTSEQLIRKAKKHGKRYELTSGEVDRFLRTFLTDRRRPDGVNDIPSTPMSRLLGFASTEVAGDRLVLEDGDHPVLKEILDLERNSRGLHRHVLLQAAEYVDCAPSALNGKFNPDKQDAQTGIHPIVAAMFFPKVPYIEEHMLCASIGHIINLKSEGLPLHYSPEQELYYDICHDPNHAACVYNNVRPLEDLRNRVAMQVSLWDAVRQLRQGKYYGPYSAKFLDALNACGCSRIDAPDLEYAYDEGTLLRKLLNGFSMRPTFVSISSMIGPIVAPVMVTPAQSFPKILTIPIINIRISALGNNQRSIDLNTSINQPQWYLDGHNVTLKAQNVILSRDVIFFYADRRNKGVDYIPVFRSQALYGLPPTVIGMDVINNAFLDYDMSLHVGEDDFDLKSMVCIEAIKYPGSNGLRATSCSACIVLPTDANSNTPGDIYRYYNPESAGGVRTDANGQSADIWPIEHIDGSSDDDTKSFHSLGRRFGTILMYVKRHT
jgi:hypothetical protein